MDDVIYLTEDFIPVSKDDPRMAMVKVRMPDGRIVFGVPEGEMKQNKLFHSGGPGSGDFGHSGRPGLVGGSGKDSETSLSVQFSDEEIDRRGDTLSEIAREYHNDAKKSLLKELVDYSSDDLGRAATEWQINKLVPFDENGKVKLYRGGNDTGLSWSTSRAWAERFARYGYGLKEKSSSQVFEREFSKEDILYAFYWEGEVIIDPSVLKKRK